MKLWAFRDLATGLVRVTALDPGPVLDPAGYAKQIAGLTGGIGLRALMENFKPVTVTLEGQMGAESYVEIEIGGLTIEQLTFLMTPPPPPEDPPVDDPPAEDPTAPAPK